MNYWVYTGKLRTSELRQALLNIDYVMQLLL